MSISWRYRRFLLAETGEIREQLQKWNKQRVAENDGVADCFYDEDRLINDPDVLKRCLELLSELRQGIETAGFQQQRDTAVLQKLYGTTTYSPERLLSEYSVWFETAHKRPNYKTNSDKARELMCLRVFAVAN